jgi:hypothetical protein
MEPRRLNYIDDVIGNTAMSSMIDRVQAVITKIAQGATKMQINELHAIANTENRFLGRGKEVKDFSLPSNSFW